MNLNDYPIWTRLKEALPAYALRAIANADYGIGAEEILPVLEEIARTGEVSSPMRWDVADVLHLAHYGGWSEESPEEMVEALFAGILLIAASGDIELVVPLDTLAYSIRRADLLGAPWLEELRDLLAGIYTDARWQAKAETAIIPAQILGLPLACLVLSSLTGEPGPVRGRWRAEVLRRIAWLDACSAEHGYPPFDWAELDFGWVWREYLSRTHADVVGFSPRLN